jgi:hypothetical protein
VAGEGAVLEDLVIEEVGGAMAQRMIIVRITFLVSL